MMSRCLGSLKLTFLSGCETFLNIFKVQGEHMVDLKIQYLVQLIDATAEDPAAGIKILSRVLRNAARAVRWGVANIHNLVGTVLGTLTAELPQVIGVFLHEVIRMAAGTMNLHHLVGSILGTLSGALPQVGWVFARMHGLFNFLSIFIWWG